MYTTAAMLADHLPTDNKISEFKPELNGRYRGIRMLLPGQTRLDPSVVYVASPDQLSILEYVDPSNLILCPDACTYNPGCPLLITQTDLLNTYQNAARVIDDCEKFDDELKSRLLAGQDLNSLVEVCAAFFQNWVQILDPAFNVIAGFTPVTDPDSSAIIGYQEDISSFSASTLDEMSKSNLLQETYTFKNAKFHKSELFKYRSVILNLYHNEEYLGKLLIIESISKLGNGTADIADQIGPYFSHLMQKRAVELNLTLHTAEYFMSEFLKGNINDPAFIVSQIAELNWHPDDLFTILAVQIKSPILTDFYCQILRNHLDDVVAFPAGDCLLAVCHLQNPDLKDVTGQISTILEEAGLLGGISEVFEDFMQARDHEAQARGALNVARQLGLPGQLHFYEDLAIINLVMSTVQANQHRPFIHPAIPRLARYDEVNHTEYVKTLQIFLTSSFNQVLAAQRLHVHRKSLQYRLNRLTKIGRINLDDPGEQLRLMLSLYFYTASADNNFS